MRLSCARGLVCRGILGLLVLALVACSSGGTASPTATTGSSGRETPTPPGSSQSLTSTVTLTAIGAYIAVYTIYTIVPLSSINGNNLNIQVADHNWEISLQFAPYTGPGSYHLTAFSAVGGLVGNIRFVNAQHTKGWELSGSEASAFCPVIIASDTAVQGQNAREIKGSFSCTALHAIFTTTPTTSPITIRNGEIDVLVKKL